MLTIGEIPIQSTKKNTYSNKKGKNKLEICRDSMSQMYSELGETYWCS